MNLEVLKATHDVADKLNVIQARYYAERNMTVCLDKWIVKDKGKKFIYLDCGGSGAFLVERATGELFNIKAYGVADRNKKLKADIGNVYTVDVEVLFTKRWNYLR